MRMHGDETRRGVRIQRNKTHCCTQCKHNGASPSINLEGATGLDDGRKLSCQSQKLLATWCRAPARCPAKLPLHASDFPRLRKDEEVAALHPFLSSRILPKDIPKLLSPRTAPEIGRFLRVLEINLHRQPVTETERTRKPRLNTRNIFTDASRLLRSLALLLRDHTLDVL